MFLRNVLCTLLCGALLLAIATPATAATADPWPRWSDCWNLVRGWFAESAIAPPPKSGPGWEPNGNSLQATGDSDTDSESDGNDVGLGWDPDGLTIGNTGGHSTETNPNG